MNIDHIDGLSQALFAESGDALFLFDPENERLLAVNAMAERLTQMSQAELLQKPVLHWFRFPQDDESQPLRQASARTGIFHSQEGYYLRTSQEDLWIPVNLTISRLHVRPKTLALITARDVREKHQAFKKLKRMEAELRRVLNSVSDCLWSARVDKEGNWTYQYLSPVVRRITGKSPEFFQAGLKAWQGLVHPDDLPRWRNFVKRLLGGQSGQEEYRLVLAQRGQLRWVRESVQANPSSSGTGLHLDGILSDITQAKQNEQEINRINRFLDSIVENVPMMLFVKDAEHLRIQLINKAGEELLGRSRADLLGKNDNDLFPPEQADFFAGNDRKVLQGRKLVEVPEEEIITGSGKKSLHTRKIPILDETDTPRYLLGISEDITMRKHLEAMVARSDKLASIGRLSAGIAHEINNPMTFVATNMNVLERDCRGLLQLLDLYQTEHERLTQVAPETAARIQALADQIDLGYIRANLERLLSHTMDGLNRVTRIVKGLRGYARTVPLPRQDVSLPELIDAGLEILQSQLKNRDIQVTREYGDAPRIPCVFSDINQVLLNLLVNACQAIEAMPANHPGRLRITLRPAQNEVILEVTDNGCGIPEEDRQRLFDPFFTTKDVNQGTGLGLWITHNIVTAHGGRIEVDSQPNQGTCLRVFLPTTVVNPLQEQMEV